MGKNSDKSFKYARNDIMWPLNINNFTKQDREDIASFISDPNNRWTQDKEVQNFEKKIASYVGSRYAVFVSSGSSANTILSQYIKDKFYTSIKNIVVLPSTTWQTSCSPWIREGFNPIFIDINLLDFSIDKNKLEKYIKNNHKYISCVFPTSLIGYVPDIDFYLYLQDKYDLKIMMDNCENTLGTFKTKNISSFFTSTTSTYFGHQIQSVEGGFIFTNDILEYEYFLMLRNHGMTRSLTSYNLDSNKYNNQNVDPSFDFYCLGNNYRNTDINAFIGQKDLKRADSYKHIRKQIYQTYYNTINKNKFFLPSIDDSNKENIPFCLPIISYDTKNTKKAIEICKSQNIEYRPIISGFLGLQTCYQKYFTDQAEYPNSMFLHNNGFYIGLHAGLTEEMVKNFAEILNTI
jgi:CDP-6-deoxy-D-xylo-4-hexulose-3-dehydrase